MATKDEQQAPVETAAAQPTPTVVTDDAVVTAPAGTRSRNGLALAGIIGGGLVAAALLFGGGVAVGLALPGHGPAGIVQAGMTGAPGGPGAPGAHGGQQAPYGPHGGDDRRDRDRPKPPQHDRGTETDAE